VRAANSKTLLEIDRREDYSALAVAKPFALDDRCS
jgi:hypothetical protein